MPCPGPMATKRRKPSVAWGKNIGQNMSILVDTYGLVVKKEKLSSIIYIEYF
jgi:hypothetical protein